MFFTEEDYKKIEKYLASCGVKDSCLEDAKLPIEGNEKIAIVQNGENRILYIRELIEALSNSKASLSDLYNVTDHAKEKYINLKQAIELVPYKARKIGQIITFLNPASKWELYQFQGTSILQWNELSLWNDFFNLDSYVIKSILPDEEDLTKLENDGKGNSYLSLKDREYNPDEFSGLGKVILRKNIMEVETEEYGKVKKNVLLQDMINKPNTIYEIRYDFDLNNQEITIPEGCVLDFQGGSLSNGALIGNNTFIESGNYTIFNNLILNEVFSTHIVYSNWFELTKDLDNTRIINSILNINSPKIIFKKYTYPLYVSVPSQGNTHSALIIEKGNKHIDFNNNIIKILPNNYDKYCCMEIKCNNVSLFNLIQHGDIKEHTGETGEQGHGLLLSICKNIEIKNCEFSYNWGDGIDIIDNYQGTICPINIKIRNCKCFYNRRQGISIEAIQGLLLDNNIFAETGRIKFTSPSSGIDIEPWQNKEYSKIKDVIVLNNTIYNNVGSNIQIQCNTRFTDKEENNNIKIVNNTIYDDYKDETCILKDTTNFIFENNKIGNEQHSISLVFYQDKKLNVINNIIYGNLYLQDGNDSKILNNNIFNNKQMNISLWGESTMAVLNNTNTTINNNYIQSLVYSSFICNSNNLQMSNNILQSSEKIKMANSASIINNFITAPQIEIMDTALIKFIGNSVLNNGDSDFCVIINSNKREDDNNSLTMLNNTLLGFDYCTGFYRKGSNVYIKTNQNIKPEKFGGYEDFWTFDSIVFNFEQNRINLTTNGKEFFDFDGQPKNIKRIGGIQQRPLIKNDGMMYSDWDIYTPIFYINEEWRTANGIIAPNKAYSPIDSTNNRPLELSTRNTGLQFYDTTIKKYIYWNGSDWADALGNNLYKYSGNFNNKPSYPDVGFAYFCTDKQTTEGATNGIMIYHKGDNVWVDALGRVVS